LLALAETAWRCLYLLAAVALLAFTVRQVLGAVDVSPAEALLAGVHRQLLAGILLSRGLPLLLRASLIVVPTFALLWVGMASLSRAATLRVLVAMESSATELRPCWFCLVGVHVLRALLALAAVLSWAGALLLCLGEVPASGSEPIAAAALVLWLFLVLLLWVAWAIVDWFLQLAPIFILRDGRGTFAAIADAVVLFQSYPSACLTLSAWFCFCRVVLFSIMSTVALICVAAARRDSLVAFVLLVLILLAYSAVASWLYMARMAAFLRLASDSAAASASSSMAEPAPLLS
jgi:hypothetical protein